MSLERLDPVKAACERAPREAKYQGALGLALYRLGKFEKASYKEGLAMLARGDPEHPMTLLCQTLAQEQLDQKERARATLARLRAMVGGPAWTTGLEAEAFFRNEIERRAALWVLSRGGLAQVEAETGLKEVKAPADLPAGRFALVRVILANRPVKEDELSHLAGLARLRFLDLGATGTGDAGLDHLRGLDSLTWLSLRGTRVTSAGLAKLARLPGLSYLELNAVGLTDQDLGALPALPGLRELHLAGGKFTDEGMQHLKGRTGLHTLSLGDTAVSDAGLKQLWGLKELKVLWVGGSKVTADGIVQLKRSLPSVDVRGK